MLISVEIQMATLTKCSEIFFPNIQFIMLVARRSIRVRYTKMCNSEHNL